MNGEKLLRYARGTFQERREFYGPSEHHFTCVAQRWSRILGCDITAKNVVTCLIELEFVRLARTEDPIPNLIDIVAYTTALAEIAPQSDLAEGI